MQPQTKWSADDPRHVPRASELTVRVVVSVVLVGIKLDSVVEPGLLVLMGYKTSSDCNVKIVTVSIRARNDNPGSGSLSRVRQPVLARPS